MPVREKGKFGLVALPHHGDRFGGIVHLQMREIESGNIDWIGWPMSGEPLMVVQFKGGSRYAYLGVSRQRAVACAYARSSGEFLNKRIKPNFEVVKLR